MGDKEWETEEIVVGGPSPLDVTDGERPRDLVADAEFVADADHLVDVLYTPGASSAMVAPDRAFT